MPYTIYLKKTIEDLMGFQALYKVYAPIDQKHRGDDIINRITKVLTAEIDRVKNDQRPDPF